MRRICAALTFMLMAQNAFAGEYNPFLGTASKESPAQRPSSKSAKLPDAIPAPLPAMLNSQLSTPTH